MLISKILDILQAPPLRPAAAHAVGFVSSCFLNRFPTRPDDMHHFRSAQRLQNVYPAHRW